MTARYLARFSATRRQRFAAWLRWLRPILAEGLVALAWFAALLIVPAVLAALL